MSLFLLLIPGHHSYSTPLEHLFIWQVSPRYGSEEKVAYEGFAALDNIVLTEGNCPGKCLVSYNVFLLIMRLSVPVLREMN